MTCETTGTASRRGRGRAAAALGLAVGVLLAGAAGGRADAAVLRWKFKQGDQLSYQMDQKTVSTAKLNGQEIKTTNTQTIDMTWKIGEVTPEGTATITQTIDRIRTKIDAPFASFEYDSKDGKQPEGPIAAGIVPTLKLLVGATFQYKMTARGELSDVKLPEGLVKQLKESSPAAGSVGMFSEDALKNLVNESSLELPAEDMAKGKSWGRKTKVPPSPIGTMSFDKTYTYEGPSDGAEKIGLKVVVSLEPAANANAKIDIKGQEGNGSFSFDNAAGRVSASAVTQKMEMVISVMNQEIGQSTETTSTMKLTGSK